MKHLIFRPTTALIFCSFFGVACSNSSPQLTNSHDDGGADSQKDDPYSPPPPPPPAKDCPLKELKNYTSSGDAMDVVSQGNSLWIATHGGLVKLDRTTLKPEFYVKNSHKFDVSLTAVAATENAVWVGSQAGGLLQIKADGSTQIFDTSTGLLGNQIRAVWAKENHAWVSVQDDDQPKGLYRIEGNDKKLYTNADFERLALRISGILEDAQGNLWLGIYDWNKPGLVKYEITNNKWSVYDTAQVLPKGAVTSIAQGDNGIWVSTTQGIAKFDFATQKFKAYTHQNSPLPDTIVNSISVVVTNHKEEVFSATDSGLARFDGTNWTIYNKANSPRLKWDRILTVKAISSDEIYVLGFGQGFLRFDGKTNWKDDYVLSNSGLPQPSVTAIAVDTHGNKWLGSSNGLTRFDGQHWRTFTTNDGLINNIISFITTRNEDVWIGTPHGLSKWNGTVFQNYKPKNIEGSIVSKTRDGYIFDNDIRKIVFDDDGNLWVATFNGIAKFDQTNQKWTSYNSENSGLKENSATSIAIDHNSIWVATNCTNDKSGVYALDIKGNQWTYYDWIPEKYRCVHAVETNKKGLLWVGSENPNGFFSIDVKNKKMGQEFDVKGSNVSAIFVHPENSNQVWHGSWKGLSIVDDTSVRTCTLGNSALPSSDVNAVAFEKRPGKSAQVWIGSASGLSLYTPAE